MPMPGMVNDMDNIEFRGKRKDTGEWVYGFLWIDRPFYCIKPRVDNTKYFIRKQHNMDWGLWTQEDFEVIPETVGRFIGVRDKYVSKIYEGDNVVAWSQGSCGKFEIKMREDGGGTPCWLLYPAWQNGEMWNIAASREKDGLVYDRGLTIVGNKYDEVKENG